MALFQKNVLARYIAATDAQQIDAAYTQFVAYFHNPERQQNILTSKEEQFQEGFLRELFVKILGYTLNPDPAYNLITEKKDVNDSKKADGAILLNDEVIGIIELKDHKTPDLSKVERQAFGYKNQHPKAKYVVISNFQKLRFYIDNAVEHIEWNLFTLTRDEFAELWLCLQYDNLSRHLPATVKSESLSREEQITNRLYKDYIAFKRVLFEDILRRNTTDEGEHSTAEWKILLFKKTQKLLDRLLFIFFAEDRDLLPPNSMREIIKQWRQLVEELDEDVRLYSRIKKYFGYMNEGHKGKKYDIFAYNGGLFKPDEVLDNLDIDDNLLAEHTLRLSEYDYASEVDVNILGHIFENSLSEIEEVTAQLQNGEAPTVSKRKKDGVFYTPQYITRYIVDNTLGKLCREKREAMGLVEEDYYDAQTRQLKTKQRMMDLLTDYRNWLLSLTICDPACGSGAFLNAALQFLIDEHKSLDKMEAALTNSDIEFPNIENSILENNLYGVDINEESVEIARLALWLRTAKPFRKLNSLNDYIKCGNSLISDPAIAGDKAFDWQKEFPQVFAKGGFDVVIGNPPYVQLQNLGEMSDKYALCGYEVFNKSADLYCLFTERGYNLLKEGGVQSFIMPNKWMLVAYGKELRKFLAKTNLCQILNFGDVQFFEDAATIVCIFVTQKSAKGEFVQALSLNNKTYHGDFDNEIKAAIDTYPASTFGEDEWTIQPRAHMDILQKMKAHKALKDLPIDIYRGVLTGYNDAFYISEQKKDELINKDSKSAELIKPFVRGRDLSAWYPNTNGQYFIAMYPACHYDIDLYPAIKEHLLSFGYERLEQSGAVGARKKTSNKWFETQDTIGYYKAFDSPKILYCEITAFFPFVYCEEPLTCNNKAFVLTARDESVNLKYLTCIFNSKLCKLWIWYNCPELLGGTREIRKVYFEHFPVPACDDQQPFIDLADRMLSLNKDLQQKRARFLRRLSDNFAEIKITSSLENFDTLTFADFIKELGKQKIRLTLVQQDEWEEYFNLYAADCQTLTQTIQATDTQIDELVYDLYNLTDSEKSLIRHS